MGKSNTKSFSEDSPQLSFTVHQYGRAIPTEVAAEALLKEGELLIRQVRENKWHNLEIQREHNVTVNGTFSFYHGKLSSPGTKLALRLFTSSSTPPQALSKSSEVT